MLQPAEIKEVTEYIKNNLSVAVVEAPDRGGDERKLRFKLSFAGKEILIGDYQPKDDDN